MLLFILQNYQPYIILVISLTTLQHIHGSLYQHHSSSLSPYTSIFNHVIQHQQTPQISIPTDITNNLRYLSSTSKINQLYEPQTHLPVHSPINHYGGSSGSILPHQQYSFTNIFGLPPLTGPLEHVSDLSYIVDGRVLKQYFVMENHDDDNSLDSYLNDPVNRNAYVQFLPHLNFAGQNRPNLGFPSGQNTQQRSAQLSQFGSFGGPVAVGSGSLGFVRHANGAVYLGSGSLGYIDNQQQTDAVNTIRNRQSPEPSPLTFGHTPQ